MICVHCKQYKAKYPSSIGLLCYRCAAIQFIPTQEHIEREKARLKNLATAHLKRDDREE